MIIKLDTTSTTPIYLQLRNQIVMGIGRGELRIGEGLPTVRQMAEDIGVNMMTVSKTYTLLKNEGYIDIDRRHGARVNPTANSKFTEKLKDELALLVTESSLQGVDRTEFLRRCDELFDSLNIRYAEG